MDTSLKAAGVGTVGLVLLVVAGGLVGVSVLDRPHVRSVTNDWGTVTSDRTEVETRIVIDNARVFELLGSVTDVEYTVSLNDVRFAHGQKENVALSGSQPAIEATTWVDNSEIPEWWASHVNHNETTTVRVDPAVNTEVLGLTFPVESKTRTRTVRTDLLAPLRSDETRRVGAYGRTLLVVEETDAHWGHATAERTPLNASATLTNPTRVPLPLTRIEYTVRMNDVVVGQGSAGAQTVLEPGSTRTIDARAAIDNSQLDEWWVTHLRRDETTRLTVDFTAVLEYRGTEISLALDPLSYERSFETDVLGPNETAADAGTGRAQIEGRRTVA